MLERRILLVTASLVLTTLAASVEASIAHAAPSDAARDTAWAWQAIRALDAASADTGEPDSTQYTLGREALVRLGRESRDSTTLAAPLGVVARSAFKRRLYVEGRSLAERAIRLSDRPGGDRLALARALTSLGQILRAQGDQPGALPPLERALHLYESIQGVDGRDVPGALTTLGLALSTPGQRDSAGRCFERAKEQLRRQGDESGPTAISIEIGLAMLSLRASDYTSALTRYQRVLEVARRTGAGRARVGTILHNMSVVQRGLGDLQGAMANAEQALDERRATLPAGHPDIALTLDAVGILRRRLGDFPGAARLHEEALAIHEKAFGPLDIRVGGTLNSLAQAYMAMDDFPRARRAYERALTIWRSPGVHDLESLALAEMNLGELLYLTRDYALADFVLASALTDMRRARGPRHTLVARVLSNQSQVSIARGDSAQARAVLREALEIQTSIFGPEHSEIALRLAELAPLLPVGGDVGAAIDTALRAETLGREHLRLQLQTISDQRALSFAMVRPEALGQALLFLLQGGDRDSQRVRSVWDALIRSRAMVLDEMASRRHALSSATDSATLRMVEDLRLARTQVSEILVAGPDRGESPDTFASRTTSAREAVDRAQRVLATHSAALRDDHGEHALEPGGVGTALGPGEVLVSYALAHPSSPAADELQHYVAFVLRAGERTPTLVRLADREQVHRAVEHWRLAVATSERSGLARDVGLARTAGEGLRQIVWDPIASRVAGASRILVVGDGALHRVNLAALPEGPGGFVVETSPPILLLDAERDLARKMSARAERPRLLALGGVDFDRAGAETRAARDPGASAAGLFRGPTSSSACFRDLRFPPLPGSALEAREASTLWSRGRGNERGEARVFSGPGAGETRFKREAPTSTDLHIATHGFVVAASCLTSNPDNAGLGDIAEDPLVRCGLALAGANRRADTGAGQDDGILTAEEIAALDLGSVGCAVLSACETGLGETQRGEGVLGLRRAFHVAGVRSLVLALWPVEEQATRRWMRAFYRARWERGLGLAEAVQTASRSVLAEQRSAGETASPAGWGAFVAEGLEEKRD